MRSVGILVFIMTILFCGAVEVKSTGAKTEPHFQELSVKFDWNSKEVKKLCDGILYTKMQLKHPRIIKLAAVKIDLTTPGLRFKMTPRDKDWGKNMPDYSHPKQKYTIRTRRETTRSFMEQAVKNGENMVAAVNGPPWGPWKAPWNHKYADWMGLLISDGVTVSFPHRNRPSFVVKKDGSCDFQHILPNDKTDHIRHAISGFVQILRDGKLTDDDKKKPSLAPRTAYGLTADRKTLFLLVVDGRQPMYSMGCNTKELAVLMRFFGASDALNMDGGGSTTLFLNDGQKMMKMNSYRFGMERTVGANMGIIIDKQTSKNN